MVQCLVGLGSNLGDRDEILDTAVQQLSTHLDVIAVSDWYSYPAIGPAVRTTNKSGDGQPDFLNGVVLADSSLGPQETAGLLHKLESSAGRKRVVRWSSRTLDADLLLFGDEIIDTKPLQVPHPRMMSRRFVLEPACQVAPEMLHPEMGWTMKALFHHLRESKPYFAVIGSDQDKTQQLIQRLVHATSGHVIESLTSDSVSNSDVSSSDGNEVLQFTSERMASEHCGDGQPRFSDFWTGQLSLNKEFESITWHSAWNPKLVLVTDSRTSKFAQQLAEIRSEYRVPTIFLSDDERDAWQDALGAVQGMS